MERVGYAISRSGLSLPGVRGFFRRCAFFASGAYNLIPNCVFSSRALSLSHQPDGRGFLLKKLKRIYDHAIASIIKVAIFVINIAGNDTQIGFYAHNFAPASINQHRKDGDKKPLMQEF